MSNSYLQKHSYILDDNIFSFLPFAPKMGEYFNIENTRIVDLEPKDDKTSVF